MSLARTDVVGLAMMALAAVGIAGVQPLLSRTVKQVKQVDEAVALPPPRQLRTMSLGYRAAAADLLWAKLLVEQGLANEQKRTFSGIRQYIDGIIELEPDHRTLYQFVDTLLVYKPGAVGTEQDARDARAYLERGTKERPYDHEVWLHYGQFVAFLAPTFLTNQAEIEQWRKEGALAIAHAVELGANADTNSSAASILAKAGETKAAIEHLKRRYALTEKQDERDQIILKLKKLEASVEVEAVVGAVEGEWRQRYPFLTRGEALLVGPHRDAAACAGPGAYEKPGCAEDWTGVADALR